MVTVGVPDGVTFMATVCPAVEAWVLEVSLPDWLEVVIVTDGFPAEALSWAAKTRIFLPVTAETIVLFPELDAAMEAYLGGTPL